VLLAKARARGNEVTEIRNRLAFALVGAATAVLFGATWLAHANPSRRPDEFLLEFVIVAQAAFVLFWIGRQTPSRKLAFAYGLALAAVAWLSLGGAMSNGPELPPGIAPDLGDGFPWAFYAPLIAAGLTLLGSLVAAPASKRDPLSTA
jgi:hypothetical protein